ncbi:acyl dehydratase [Baekduia soli]|uniref:Acyl dehydratase n=1 Tax=Baekduia soli TaxID=496014 RepID=A0A5B8U4R8_9ACTN|nr:MaoC family dehydratase [Baekduia soli]QEC48116.1 acyl dehydratase [Baekduia soli]
MPDPTAFTPVTDVVTQANIDAYAELSGDFNPLHVDPEAAAASEFGGIIAHGPIALHAFFRAATAWLGVDALPPGSEVKVTYRAPTRPGDSITSELRSSEDLGDGRTAVEADCVNQDGTTVVSVRAVLATP